MSTTIPRRFISRTTSRPKSDNPPWSGRRGRSSHVFSRSRHFGGNDYAIRKSVEYIRVENLDAGNIIVLNYPYWNSAHASDVTLRPRVQL